MHIPIPRRNRDRLTSRFTLTLLAMALLSALLAGPVSAGPEVPFGGRMNATEASVELIGVNPLTLKFTYTFSGQASHLGRSTGLAQAVVHPTANGAKILSTSLTPTA